MHYGNVAVMLAVYKYYNGIVAVIIDFIGKLRFLKIKLFLKYFIYGNIAL